MIKVEGLLQGTPEWIDWRRLGVGASEVPAVIGVCPYSTAYKVFMEKTGKYTGFAGNYATQRGTELEPKARALYELLYMEDMPPALVIHPKYEIVRVSLDGIRADGRLILEIKCLGKENHELVKSGIVPPHYIPQVQYQLAATGADMCHFFSYGSDESHGLIEVMPDVEYQGMLIAKVLEFWELVKSNTPPPLTDRDDKVVDGGEVAEICTNILANKDKMKKAELDLLKERIINLGGHNKIRCGSVLVSKSITSTGKNSFRLTIS